VDFLYFQKELIARFNKPGQNYVDYETICKKYRRYGRKFWCFQYVTKYYQSAPWDRMLLKTESGKINVAVITNNLQYT
jgi:hypothetical protein